MDTLVLGHGKFYLTGKNTIRCSPIPVSEWINGPYVSVDNNSQVQPDILYDLAKIPWSFASDMSYDRIIDTTGLGLKGFYGKDYFEAEIRRILKPNGGFYGSRNGYVIKK